MIVNHKLKKNKTISFKISKNNFRVKGRLNLLQIVLNKNIYLRNLDIVNLG